MAILYPERNIGAWAVKSPEWPQFASFAARASNGLIGLNNPDFRGLEKNRNCPKGALK